MTYHFRLLQEIAWSAAIAGIAALAAAAGAVEFDVFSADPVGTLLGLGLIFGRAAIAAAIAKLNGSFSLK